MVVVPENECFLAADDSGVFELGCDAACGVARVQHDEGLAGRRSGRHERPGEPSCSSENRDKKQPDELPHSSLSLDDCLDDADLTMVIRLSGWFHRDSLSQKTFKEA